MLLFTPNILVVDTGTIERVRCTCMAPPGRYPGACRGTEGRTTGPGSACRRTGRSRAGS